MGWRQRAHPRPDHSGRRALDELSRSLCDNDSNSGLSRDDTRGGAPTDLRCSSLEEHPPGRFCMEQTLERSEHFIPLGLFSSDSRRGIDAELESEPIYHSHCCIFLRNSTFQRNDIKQYVGVCARLWGRCSCPASCRSFIVGEGVVSTFLVVSFDLMLVFRVWILYGKKRRMSYVLCAVLLAELVSMLIILLLSAPYLHDFVHLGHVLPGCYFIAPVGRGPYFAVYALPPLLVTFAMFILTVYKCSKTLYQEKSTEMPIITLFLRDGIVWFLIVFGVDGLQMLVWATGRATLTQVLIIPSLVLHSLVASRVLLNIRSLPGLGVLEDGQEAERLLPGAGSWGA
ncbi:hypothetical protein B0H15DRAFT_171571 [Mycena belliarum]|uniref:Uncharacterized protein n=1 Tax=Mycena belliarum TaxID=1033014 RepID=A0AAD6XP00_9AGAR|nr:hypothetical protein B0H15DRAFT_171571 [Mycena belliae]